MKNNVKLNPEMMSKVISGKLFVLRDRDGCALNVSYSEDGLKFTFNKSGRNIYDSAISRGGWVERFVPRDHKDSRRQSAEVSWVAKGQKLLYDV